VVLASCSVALWSVVDSNPNPLGQHAGLLVPGGVPELPERLRVGPPRSLLLSGLELFEIDVEQVDERAVPLVGDVAAVEAALLVDFGSGRGVAERERTRETVRIVVTDDGESFASARRALSDCGLFITRQFGSRTERR